MWNPLNLVPSTNNVIDKEGKIPILFAVTKQNLMGPARLHWTPARAKEYTRGLTAVIL